MLHPALGDELPFVIAAPVSLFCALMWGAGPGAVATLICLFGTLIPGLSPDILTRAGATKAFGFAMAMTVACVLVARVEALRRTADTHTAGIETPLVKWLNAALLGAVLLPATAFIVIAWWTYDRAVAESRDTAVRRVDLVFEHAKRTFGVAARLADEAALLTDGSDAEIHSNEGDVRQRLSDMLLGVPAVVNLNVWSAQAVPLARSDRAIDLAATIVDRDYFRRQAETDRGFDISEVLKGRQTGRELFNVTRRRLASEGIFAGIVSVSMNPEYFREYYRAIVAQNTDVESISLVRTDGTFLARWPQSPEPEVRLPDTASSLDRVRRGESSGIVYGRAQVSGDKRVAAFRRLDGLPAYVLVSFSEAPMFAAWGRLIGIVAAMALPITLLLIAVTTIARRRVRSEQRAQVELHEQMRLRAATERAALEAHRRDTLAMLTAGVAHDFNNLLAIVSNSLHVQNVKHPFLSAEPQSAAMRRAVQSGTRLTRQLLSFTRKQALRPELVDLGTWLPDLEELLKTTLGSRIRLTLSVAEEIPRVFVDTAELELALVNLAVNARHAQRLGGAFAVTAQAVREAGVHRVLICARDEGEGIPADLLSRVTEPFFTTKEAGTGSGLGLYQVRSFVEAAGGLLRIESEVGRGTRITLLLPSVESDIPHVPGADEDAASPLPRLAGHVLVVEDNDEVAAVTSTLIASLGLKVTRAATAEEALHVLRQRDLGGDIGFMLTDVAMPGPVDGIALALQVCFMHPHMQVTVITGFAENMQSALDAELDVLHKPLAFHELLARLRVAFPNAARP